MFKSILLPVDIASEASWKKPLELAIELARAGGGVVHVMTVLPDFGMSVVGSYFGEDFEKKALKQVSEEIEAFVARNLPQDVMAKAHVAHGTIYHEIIRAADKLGCDAIVIAAHRPEVSDYLLGSNAARVVRHAKQSVLVVRD